jgi:hypothetical protein
MSADSEVRAVQTMQRIMQTNEERDALISKWEALELLKNRDKPKMDHNELARQVRALLSQSETLESEWNTLSSELVALAHQV